MVGLDTLSRPADDGSGTLGARMPIHRGDKKGMVERIGGVIVNAVTERLPGKTFNKISEKPFNYNPKKHASITLSVLREAVYRYIVDYYHHHPKAVIGMSPLKKWHMESKVRPPRLPPSIDYFDAHIGLVAYRKVTHKGIEFQNMLYNSKELGSYIQNHGHHQVKIRYNPEDLGSIIVMNREGGYFRVPANRSYFDYANGMSLPVHEAINKHLNNQEKSEKSPEELVLTRHQMHKQVLSSIEKDKKRFNRISSNWVKTMPVTKQMKEVSHEISGFEEKPDRQLIAWDDEDIPDLEGI